MPKGIHGNHMRGSQHYRWNQAKIITSHGYVKVRVGRSHPLADPNGYAYEHTLVAMTALGRPLAPGEIIHHRNHDRTDNRWGNLLVEKRGSHNDHHAGGDRNLLTGRFVPRSTPVSEPRVMPELAAQVFEHRSSGLTHRQIAKATGLSKTTVGRILRGDPRHDSAGRVLDGRTWDEFPTPRVSA